MKLFIYKPTLIVGFAVVLCCGCGSRPSKESAREEQKVREVATAYRDAYVSGFTTLDAGETFTNLLQSSIQSVEKSSNGWLVIFSTHHASNSTTSPTQLKQIHVYIKPSGELGKILSK